MGHLEGTKHRVESVVIAGGGLAGLRTAQALRDLGYLGRLQILSAEQQPPYDRPPLSKDFLRPDFPDGGLDLLPFAHYAEQHIELRLGDPAVALDIDARQVRAASGQMIDYDALVVATGARARTLPNLEGSAAVMSLRNVDDAVRLRSAFDAQERIVVIGGGFIGLEVAATARAAGCSVTIVEALPAPLAGILGSYLSGWLQQQHVERGVQFRCGVTVESSTSTPGGEQLLLSDGSQLTADTVVVGVGVTRDLGWLADAGLEVHVGLVCDEAGRASISGVYGAGDIVCQHIDGSCAQIQHWTAATLSARRVAQAVLSIDKPAPPDDAFFWSDQYDLRIQFAGHADARADVEIVSGSFGSGAFTARYMADGQPTGAFAVNSPREFLRLRLALRTADLQPRESVT
jgi:3-phenylpropionate/trans-cinnamate dioxygenase ferredoxin reductase component